MLKTDYSNDVFEGNRKYQITDNSDGTKSIEDVTTYTNEGDVFGAEDINATNKAVNGIMSSTADAYNPESTYSSGDYCIQNNTLYKANQDIDTPEEWTAGHWDATTVAEELDLLNQNMTGYIDTDNVLATITTAGASYTATENCWVIGIHENNGALGSQVFLNGITVGTIYDRTTHAILSSSVCFPVMKGQTVTTRSVGTYELTVYGVKH